MTDSTNVVPFHRQPASSLAELAQRYMGSALNTLSQIASDPTAPESVRAEAAAMLAKYDRLRNGGAAQPPPAA